MKALLLAAGRGTRLCPLTDERPKSMVEVCGRPILLKQIENLVDNGVSDITVIAGYKADVLSSRVKAEYPFVNIIVSTEYASTNNMVSATMGREAVAGGPFIMMNADVFLDGSVIAALLAHPDENAIVTDVGRYLEESMKVTEQGGRLTAISKTISEADALGSSIDVYRFSAEAGSAFFRACREYIDVKEERTLWSEVALNAILPHVRFTACPLIGRWVEIDNHEDLAYANRLFSNDISEVTA